MQTRAVIQVPLPGECPRETGMGGSLGFQLGYSPAAVERIWHKQNSQDHILVLASG